MKRPAVVAAAALLLGACGGPKPPLEIGSKTVAVNVQFGKPRIEVPEGVAPPPVELQEVRGGLVAVPVPSATPAAPRRPAPHPEPCPAASPFAFPAKEATSFVQPPAPEGTHVFRAAGTVERRGSTFPYPGTTLRTISGASASSDGTSRFEVREALPGGVTVTTTYVADASQVAVARVMVSEGSTTRAITPLPPVKVLPLPPQQADPLGQPVTTWQAAGTDPTSGATMTVEGTVRSRERVDACGKLVDSWVAEATLRLLGPFEDLTTVTRTNYATQYGGMVVAEKTTSSGTLLGASFRNEVEAAINAVPA